MSGPLTERDGTGRQARLKVWLRRSVSLTLLAGATVFVLLPAAHAGRPEHRAQVTPPVGAAGKQALELIHDQSLAVGRNTHYLEQRDRFTMLLLRLNQKTPAKPRQAEQIARAIHADQRALTHVDRNILLSRAHLLSTLPAKVSRVHSLVNTMGDLAPENRRVAAFMAFVLRRQQTVLNQLIRIMNQEQASAILPGE